MASETEKRGIESVSGGSSETQLIKRKRYNDIRFRLLFHQDSVGRVIGRNGENLKQARQDISSKAHLRVPELPTSVHSKDRILMVSCELTDVARLLKKLAPSLWHAQEGQPQKEFNLLIPSDIAGAVLGKGGSTLKELRERHGCKVKMHKDKLPFSDERVLEIPGKDGQLEAMIDTLISALTILQEKPLEHDYIRYTPHVCRDTDYRDLQCGGYMKTYYEKGGEGKLNLTVRSDGQLTGHHTSHDTAGVCYNYSSSSPADLSSYKSTSDMIQGYDNSNYNSYYSQSYASQQMMSSQYSSSMYPSMDTSTGSYSGYNTLSQSDSYNSSYNMPPTQSPRTPPPRSTPRSGRKEDSFNRSRDRSRSPPPRMIVDDFMNEEITKDITVDDSLTSSIIGPKGSRITSIRKKTSAFIKIGNDSSVSDGTRKITITGTMKEVMWAFNAVKSLIVEAGDEVKRGEGGQKEMVEMSSYQAPQSKLFDLAKTLIPFNPNSDSSEERITKEIRIPNKNAGMVLGRKASIINEIRATSSCKINVAKDSEVSGEDRTIQISGTPRGVHLAEYLIEAVQQMPRDTPQMLGLL